MIDIKAKMFQFFNYLKGVALLRYVLDLVSQGLSGVSITPAVGQRTQVVSGHNASSYDESIPRFRVKIKDLSSQWSAVTWCQAWLPLAEIVWIPTEECGLHSKWASKLCGQRNLQETSTTEKKTDRTEKRDGNTSGWKSRECIYCVGIHEHNKNKCPAFGKICRKCGKPNHFQSVCLQRQSIHKVQEESASKDESVYCTESVGVVEHQHKRQFLVALCFFEENGETLVQCQLDTGDTCNVMSFDKLSEIKQSGKPGMQPTTSKLRLYDGSLVQALGECDLQCKYKGNQHLLNFKIISGSQQPLLSGKTYTGMGLITVHVVNSINMSQATMPQDILTKYKDVVEGLGCLPGEYHLEIDPTCRPVKHTPRKVVIPLKAKLKAHIKELEKIQVLKKVTQPTKVVVCKEDKLRLCNDPKDLNKALKPSHYPMPMIEEILPELSKVKVFSVADARHGFWQVKLDVPSSYLTTFWTPFGR